MKLFALFAILLCSVLAEQTEQTEYTELSYPTLMDKIYMHLQHNSRDKNEVYARIRLRWDKFEGSDAYQVCRNCQIDEFGVEIDETVGSLYTFKNDPERDDIDPYFICNDEMDEHHCVGAIYQTGIQAVYLSVRANTENGYTRWSPPKRYELDPEKIEDPAEVEVLRKEL